MPDNLYLVFSNPPDGVSAEEYDRWYDHHVRENIVSPGFLSAQRFALTPARDAPPGFSHLALYEYAGDMELWRADLDRRIGSGDIVLPEWFGGIKFGSWSAAPLTDRIEPVR